MAQIDVKKSFDEVIQEKIENIVKEIISGDDSHLSLMKRFASYYSRCRLPEATKITEFLEELFTKLKSAEVEDLEWLTRVIGCVGKGKQPFHKAILQDLRRDAQRIEKKDEHRMLLWLTAVIFAKAHLPKRELKLKIKHDLKQIAEEIEKEDISKIVLQVSDFILV